MHAETFISGNVVSNRNIRVLMFQVDTLEAFIWSVNFIAQKQPKSMS